MDKYAFQYCPKLVVLSEDLTKVLLCKRKGEADYDGTFSFIGGKLEVNDGSIAEGIKREKDEEVGETFQLNLYDTFSLDILFRKKDGSSMIVPHYLALHTSGDITLNTEEYSEYKWVPIEELETFEPKIKNIPEITGKLLLLKEANIVGITIQI
jgi:8-oxo-dGTP pyrophosphatase MutT (NUDIX family)